MIGNQKFISALMLSSALVMGACSAKDKGADAVKSAAEVAKVSVDSVDAKALEPLLKVAPRKVADVEAEKALGLMGLDATNKKITWSDKDGKTGSYTYKDVAVAGDNGESVKIAKLTLNGVHMAEDNPSFDRLDAEDISIDGDDGLLTIENVSLARPSPKLGQGVMKAVETIGSIRDWGDMDVNVDLDDGELAFGAALIDGMSFKSENANATLDLFGWGEDPETSKGVFVLEDFDLTGKDDLDDTPISVSVESISANGIDLDYFRSLGVDGSGKDLINRSRSMSQKGSPFNPYAQSFDNFKMEDVAINIDTLSISTEGASGTSSKRGDVTTVRQSLSPVKIGFSGDPSDPDLMQMRDVLSEIGFETLEFSASQTSVLDEGNDSFSVTDAVLDLKDGFNLSYDYEGTGLSALKDTDDPDQIEAAMGQMKLKSMNMALTDYNLVNRAIEFAAKQQGTSAALIKMQLKGGLMVASLGAQNEAQGRALTDLGNALGQFVDQGGTLKISLNPETPISVDRFQGVSPENIDPSDFGFSIEHVR